MAFEISGTILAEGAIDAIGTDAALELMPLATDAFLSSTFEGAGFALPELGAGASTLGSALGSEIAPAVLQQAVTPAAEGVIAGGEGAGAGITSATPSAVQTGAALPEAPSAGINQIASANVPGGPVTDVGVNPDYTAWKNAIDTNQFVPNQELSSEVLQASGNAPAPSAPSGTENLGQGLKPNPPGIGTQTISPGTLSAPSQPYGINPGTAPGGGISGGPLGTGVNPSLANLAPTTPESGFMDGFSNFVDKHPFMTGAGIYAVANATGMLNPPRQTFGQQNTGGFYSPYRFSPNFQGTHPNPSDYQYKPNYSGMAGSSYAEGGITSVPRYSTGDLTTTPGGRGDVYSATQRFLNMYDPASRYQAPAGLPDVGIVTDTSPSTRYQDAATAAATRQNAINKKANVNVPTNYGIPTRTIGQLNFAPQTGKPQQQTADNSDQVLAASGGIMGYSLGGYASGGNPRLLQGPGDGMSDNIPATIGNRQPARLANGEFVVPADVVSHLGNGSTDAGAKRLHQMMDQVRMDRTGKKKQAPAVKANKYIPK